MDFFSGKITGRHTLSRDVTFAGLAIGDMIVPGGIVLVLTGLVTGNLIVEPGGKATIDGTVEGTVINNGGTVVIRGRAGRVGGGYPIEVSPCATVGRRS